MKYCKKCGTLLEDSQLLCIACGADASVEENISLYPLEMEQEITSEKNNQKKRTGLIVAIVGIFLALVGLIAALIIFVSNHADEMAMPEEEFYSDEFSGDGEDFGEYDEVEYQLEEETVEEESGLSEGFGADLVTGDSSASVEEPAAVTPENRTVKDELGTYYSIGTISDAAGNTIFTTLYPEDFQVVASDVSYDKYSVRYPENITYMVSDADNAVQFTYMSPQHFWHRKSSKGKSRTNERDVFNYMTYYTYGVQNYIEALINASYKDIKKLDFKEKKSIGSTPEGKIKEISDAYTMTLMGDIGDYAKIASDATYAPMAAECEANIYSYQATSRQNNTIYIDFYVPAMANTLSYSSAQESDQGDVIEWVTPCIIVFEAGSEDHYNQYMDAYKTFISSSRLTREFFYDNYKYSEYLKSCIKDGSTPTKLNKDKLKEYHDSYNSSSDIGTYNEGVYAFLNTSPETNSIFKNDTMEFSTPGAMKVGFYNAEKGKIFVSPDENEYPGEGYQDMQATIGSTPEAAQDPQ